MILVTSLTISSSFCWLRGWSVSHTESLHILLLCTLSAISEKRRTGCGFHAAKVFSHSNSSDEGPLRVQSQPYPNMDSGEDASASSLPASAALAVAIAAAAVECVVDAPPSVSWGFNFPAPSLSFGCRSENGRDAARKNSAVARRQKKSGWNIFLRVETIPMHKCYALD